MTKVCKVDLNSLVFICRIQEEAVWSSALGCWCCNLKVPGFLGSPELKSLVTLCK